MQVWSADGQARKDVLRDVLDLNWIERGLRPQSSLPKEE